MCLTPKELKNLILFSNKVTPLIFTSGFGIFLVKGSKRVPNPADKINAFFTFI
jgi:hypothetical protein